MLDPQRLRTKVQQRSAFWPSDLREQHIGLGLIRSQGVLGMPMLSVGNIMQQDDAPLQGAAPRWKLNCSHSTPLPIWPRELSKVSVLFTGTGCLTSQDGFHIFSIMINYGF